MNPEAITPNLFLRPNANNTVLIKSTREDEWLPSPPSNDKVIKSIENREALLDKFRELWYQDYLLGLREQCRDLHELDFDNKIKENEIVLVKNPLKPRPFWALGRVTELIHGDDNKVCSVKLKRGDGSVQLHSIKHLYPLELSLTHPQSPPPTDGPNLQGNAEGTVPPDALQPIAQATSTSTTPLHRPRRAATSKKKQRSPDDPYVYY